MQTNMLPNKKTKATVSDLLPVVYEASDDVNAKREYQSGIVALNPNEDKTIYTGFFQSPDGQDLMMYYALLERGFVNAGYSAPYFWKVRYGRVVFTYTEGDISLFNIDDNQKK